ncbi:MAG: HAD family hydrolase [Candidatus Paceibacterota bacterium]
MDEFGNFNGSPEKRKWISVTSEFQSLNGAYPEIKISLDAKGEPGAFAFFDIDGTLAHLSSIHGRAIAKLFPEQEPKELEATYYRGFKLGNSFREFDRMRGIYTDGHTEWKDPEVYLKDRFIPHAKEIDEPGNLAHEIAAGILKAYGEIAAQICDEIFEKNPEEFKKSNIAPIFKLAQMYGRLGIPMVGFTANAKVLVEKLAKYLGLSDIFIDIATDETMAGGGKEIAIKHLMGVIESKGIRVPKDKLIFVGDSLRGDIGTGRGLGFKNKGILVLKDKDELIAIEEQINSDPELRKLADTINIEGLTVEDVPLDDKGNPILLSRFRKQFLKKL